MHDHRHEFLRFALAAGALRFGAFTLKSGRHSPYFFDAGRFASGARLARLGQFYAAAIDAARIEFDLVFGPAYKGIPLAIGVAMALAARHDRDLPYAFDRKETKDHGEGGRIVGAPLAGRVLIVDDVMTAGTSVDAAIATIRAAGAHPVGVAIMLDRAERARDSEHSAADEVRARHGLPVISIVGFDDLID